MTLTSPTMPNGHSIFQKMIDNFGTAGTVAIAIIGGAIALGVLVILAMYGWRLTKHWFLGRELLGDYQYEDGYETYMADHK